MVANPSVRTVLEWLGRLILGGTFVVAAVLKIKDPPAFVAAVEHYRLLPYPLALAMGIYLPWLELLCGTAVLIRRLEQGALLILTSLCLLFCVALATAWFRGLDIDCGCFGHAIVSSSLSLALARSLTLGLVALYLLNRSCADLDPSHSRNRA